MVDREEFDRAIGVQDKATIDRLLYETAKIIAHKSTRKRDTREELAQEIWLHLASKLSRVDPSKGSAWSYLYTCGARYAWKLTRRGKRRSEVEGWLGDIEVETVSLAADAADDAAAIDARDAVEELRSDPEIAALLDALGDQNIWSREQSQNRPMWSRIAASLAIETHEPVSRRRVAELIDRAREMFKARQRRLGGYEPPRPMPMLKPSEFGPLPVLGEQLSLDWGLSPVAA